MLTLLPQSPAAPPKDFSLLGRCMELCSLKPATLVFTDGEDSRAVRAAMRLRGEGLAKVVLLGRPLALRRYLRDSVSGKGAGENVTVMDPASPEFLARNTADYIKIMHEAGKSVTGDEARRFMATAPAAGAMMVRRGEVEGGIGGNVSSTADMLRAGLRVLGLEPGCNTVSSFFFMIAPVGSHDPRKILVFADGGVVPEPTAEQLADIALGAASQFTGMTGQEARVALLSFSSHGSAKHPRADFVRTVARSLRERRPDLMVDGELQLDAAIVPEVAKQKVPESALGGMANVLVFPSLEAGNIGYKLAQRLGGYTAIGPLLQGLNGCWHDLSRGCSEKDMYQTALIGTALHRKRGN